MNQLPAHKLRKTAIREFPGFPAWILLFYITLSCSSHKPFKHQLYNCQPADTIIEMGNIRYKVEIIGDTANGCKIKTQFVKTPNPAFEKKSMICVVNPNHDFTMAMQNLDNCRGSLKKYISMHDNKSGGAQPTAKRTKAPACKTWERWQHHLFRPRIHQQIHQGDTLWMATSGGLLALHKPTGTFRAYTKANSGLPSNSIKHIALDSVGALWLASDEEDYAYGLVHWTPRDKATCTNYTAQNSKLPYDVITSLAVGPKGDLWAGSDNGHLSRLDASGKWSVLSDNNAYLPQSEIKDFAFTKDGKVWIATSNRGIIRYNPGKNKDSERWQAFTKDAGLSNNYIRSIALAPSGNLWVYCSKFGTKALHTISPSGSVGSTGTYAGEIKHIKGLAQGPEGKAWLLTKTAIWKIAGPQDITRVALPNDLPSKFITSVSADAETIWLGRYKGLASISHKGVLKEFIDDNRYGFPDYKLQSMHATGNGSIWLGARQILAQYSQSGNWTFLEGKGSGVPVNPEDQDPEAINFMHRIGKDKILMGTYSGLFTFTPSSPGTKPVPLEGVQLQNPEYGAGFRQAVEDATGNIWIATRQGLMQRKPDGTFAYYSENNSGLPSNKLYDVAITQKNILLVGTESGLARTATDQVDFQVFQGEVTENITVEEIKSLAVDKQGRAYFPITYSKNGGIVQYNPNGSQWREFELRAEGNRINRRQHCFMEVTSNLAIDSMDRIWMGARPSGDDFGSSPCNQSKSGLAVFAGGKWNLLKAESSGFPHGSIKHVMIDAQNHLWMDIKSFESGDSGVNGIARYKLPDAAEMLMMQLHGNTR